MVDIRDFFGNTPKKAPKPVKKRAAEGSTEPKPKKTKVSKPKDDDDVVVIDDDFNDDNDFDDDDFADDDIKSDDFDDDFNDAALDDDDDVELLEELSGPPSGKSSNTRSKRSDSANAVKVPMKQAKEEEVVKPAPAPKVATPMKKAPTKAPAKAKTTSNTATGITAMEILAQIPDAELPEDIPTDAGTFNYQQFKARQTEVAPSSGSIELPEGAPNCLTGLTMVFTGVMPNIDREDAESLAKRYGAKVTKSISGKTSVVVLGAEAGPSKVRKIKQHNIKAIDEDGFIQLIKGMPEEGGDGDAAEKARVKRLEEEEKARQQSVLLEAEAEVDAKKRDAAIREAQKAGKSINSSQLKMDDEKLWTVRYAPTKLEQLCGNKSTIEKLRQWLTDWPRKFGNRKPEKGETEFRAVLIHGPPGIGKTSAAHLVAKSLGYDIIEKNASDVRSKNLLNSNIGGILDNTSVMGYFQKNETHSVNNQKFCIIMDEVDGMSGGDRGGVGQLAAFAKKTQAPMILICNDKSLPKMRPFDRVTLDLPFRRPSAREMKSRLMTIALREHIKLDPNIIDQLVQTTSNDIRQIINLLSTVSMTQKNIDSSNTKGIASDWQKNIALKPFDIIPRILSAQTWLENGPVPLFKKMEWYFDDHAFVPLMMQENYLNSRPSRASSKLRHLELVATAADSISLGDLVDKKIHSAEQLWSLMPLHAIMSTVRPASIVSGGLSGRVNFSAWLGQNSKTGKYQRLLAELHYHSRLRTSTDSVEFRLEYVPVLAKRLLTPLVESGDNIPDVVKMLDYYYLSKADWDFLMEFPIGKDDTAALLKQVPTATKSKFTRKYNADVHPVAVFRAGMFEATKGKKAKKEEDKEETPEEEPDLVADL